MCTCSPWHLVLSPLSLPVDPSDGSSNEKNLQGRVFMRACKHVLVRTCVRTQKYVRVSHAVMIETRARSRRKSRTTIDMGSAEQTKCGAILNEAT